MGCDDPYCASASVCGGVRLEFARDVSDGCCTDTRTLLDTRLIGFSPPDIVFWTPFSSPVNELVADELELELELEPVKARRAVVPLEDLGVLTKLDTVVAK